MADEILIVEDNPLNQKLAVRYLQSRGFYTRVAGTTLEAEARIAEAIPRVILMDLSLPGEDGLTLVRRLRQKDGPRIPIIALTAHAMAGDCERALAAGCDFYLSKPVDFTALLSTIRTFTDPVDGGA